MHHRGCVRAKIDQLLATGYKKHYNNSNNKNKITHEYNSQKLGAVIHNGQYMQGPITVLNKAILSCVCYKLQIVLLSCPYCLYIVTKHSYIELHRILTSKSFAVSAKPAHRIASNTVIQVFGWFPAPSIHFKRTFKQQSLALL